MSIDRHCRGMGSDSKTAHTLQKWSVINISSDMFDINKILGRSQTCEQFLIYKQTVPIIDYLVVEHSLKTIINYTQKQ